MTTYIDTSDRSAHVHYTGTILAEGSNENQSWKVLATDSFGPCLFIDGQLQSCARDEEIYHETFVHSLMCGLQEPKRILVLGGAEGCMLREILKWSSVESVLQIDWDKELCSWFKTNPVAKHWTGVHEAYQDPRMTLLHEDAVAWTNSYKGLPFDAIFLDLLDPSPETYTMMKELLQACLRIVSPTGGIAMNAGNVRPLSFGGDEPCVDLGVFVSGLSTHLKPMAIRQIVPSFLGEWCFFLLCPKTWSQIKDSRLFPKTNSFSRTTLIQSLTWPENYPYVLRTLYRQKSEKPSIQIPSTPSPSSLHSERVSEKLVQQSSSICSNDFSHREKLVDEFPPAHFTEIDFTQHYGC